VVGRALKEWRGSKPTLYQSAACAGMRRRVQKVLSAESIRREVEDSLRRLSIDVIDL